MNHFIFVALVGKTLHMLLIDAKDLSSAETAGKEMVTPRWPPPDLRAVGCKWLGTWDFPKADAVVTGTFARRLDTEMQ